MRQKANKHEVQDERSILTAKRSFVVCFQIECSTALGVISTIPHTGTFTITCQALSFLKVGAWIRFPRAAVLYRCNEVFSSSHVFTGHTPDQL